MTLVYTSILFFHVQLSFGKMLMRKHLFVYVMDILKNFFYKECHASDLEKRLVKQICHWDDEPVPYTSRHTYTCIYPIPKYCFPFSIYCYTRGRILQQEANYLFEYLRRNLRFTINFGWLSPEQVSKILL